MCFNDNQRWRINRLTQTACRPKIVCLCGSTRFKEAFEKAQKDETILGKIVLTVGLFGHLEGMDMNGEVKSKLDELHLQKIRLADEVLILNVGGYIGPSTSNEIAFARKLGRPIRYLERWFAKQIKENKYSIIDTSFNECDIFDIDVNPSFEKEKIVAMIVESLNKTMP